MQSSEEEPSSSEEESVGDAVSVRDEEQLPEDVESVFTEQSISTARTQISVYNTTELVGQEEGNLLLGNDESEHSVRSQEGSDQRSTRESQWWQRMVQAQDNREHDRNMRIMTDDSLIRLWEGSEHGFLEDGDVKDLDHACRMLTRHLGEGVNPHEANIVDIMLTAQAELKGLDKGIKQLCLMLVDTVAKIANWEVVPMWIKDELAKSQWFIGCAGCSDSRIVKERLDLRVAEDNNAEEDEFEASLRAVFQEDTEGVDEELRRVLVRNDLVLTEVLERGILSLSAHVDMKERLFPFEAAAALVTFERLARKSQQEGTKKLQQLLDQAITAKKALERRIQFQLAESDKRQSETARIVSQTRDIGSANFQLTRSLQAHIQGLTTSVSGLQHMMTSTASAWHSSGTVYVSGGVGGQSVQRSQRSPPATGPRILSRAEATPASTAARGSRAGSAKNRATVPRSLATSGDMPGAASEEIVSSEVVGNTDSAFMDETQTGDLLMSHRGGEFDVDITTINSEQWCTVTRKAIMTCLKVSS